jgi:hypothetical protein
MLLLENKKSILISIINNLLQEQYVLAETSEEFFAGSPGRTNA